MTACVYTSEDLTLFRSVLDAAMDEVRTSGLAPVGEDDVRELSTRMAAAIFDCAAAGVRDVERIKIHAFSAALDRQTLHLLVPRNA